MSASRWTTEPGSAAAASKRCVSSWSRMTRCGRLEQRHLPSELGADRTATAGDQHPATAEELADLVEVGVDLGPAEQVGDLEVTHVLQGDLRPDQLRGRRNHAERETEVATLAREPAHEPRVRGSDCQHDPRRLAPGGRPRRGPRDCRALERRGPTGPCSRASSSSRPTTRTVGCVEKACTSAPPASPAPSTSNRSVSPPVRRCQRTRRDQNRKAPAAPQQRTVAMTGTDSGTGRPASHTSGDEHREDRALGDDDLPGLAGRWRSGGRRSRARPRRAGERSAPERRAGSRSTGPPPPPAARRRSAASGQ